MKRKSVMKLALFGMLIALAFVLSYVEYLIPINFGVPGIKLGLANIVILLALYLLGAVQAFQLSLIRVLLISFTYGNLYSIWYSLAGAILSFCVMLLMKKLKFGIVGVSVSGGVAHNLGQVIIAMLILGRGIIYYFSMLMFGGIITGILVGIMGAIIYKPIRKVYSYVTE